MRFMSNKSVLLASCGLAIMAVPATAQDSEVDEDVIIVTAQNRAQDVTDVPIAIDVITGDELAAQGFSDANDLGQIAPAVQVVQDQGTVKITLRGIGTTSNDEAQDTSVVANIDGEYINRPNVLGVAIFDLERVEVLRGPQGTLYGRNSTAGAINFVTRKPGDEFGANASVSFGNYDAVRVDAGIDVPLGDAIGVRFAGFYDDRNGYIRHPSGYGFGPFPVFAGGRSDDNTSYGGRTTLDFDNGGAFTATLAFEFADREFTPQAFAFADLNASGNAPTGPGCNRDGYTEVAPAYAETLCVPSQTNFLEDYDRAEYSAPGFGLGRVGDETWAVRGRLAYEFSPAATLTYIAGYREYTGDPTSVRTLPVAYRSFTFQDEAQTQSHELRLNGDLGGIIYQIGAFYFNEQQDRESGFFLPIGANGSFLSYFGRYVESDSWSAFGQVEVPLGETLTAVGGLRYTDNQREAVYLNGGPFFNPLADVFAGNPPPGGAPDSYIFNAGPARKDFDLMRYRQTLNLGSDDDKITWLVGLNWQPNPDTLIYAKVSTGFKGGGFDSVGTYGPESNRAYEAGAKLTFGPQGEHQFNLGGFYYDYTGLQVSVLLDTTIGGQTFNAGAATIWGLEAEGSFQFGDNTVFDVSVNYLDTTYDELFAQFNVFCVGGCALNGIGDLDPNTAGVQQPNFAGNRAPFSPKVILRAGLQHTFDFGEDGTITGGIATTMKSSYFTDFYNYNDGRQASLTQTDLSIEWRNESETLGVQFYARNLENERPLTYGSFVSAGPDDIFNWQFGTPTTFGVRLSLDY